MKVTKELSKEQAATKAGRWLRTLEKLKGKANDGAWNRMIAEAIVQECEDSTGCEIFTFDDESVLRYGRQVAPYFEREVVLPMNVPVRRALYQWRLAGTRLIEPRYKLYSAVPSITARLAAKRLGITLSELRRLCREGNLSAFSDKSSSCKLFYINELDYYRKRHPIQSMADSSQATRRFLREHD